MNIDRDVLGAIERTSDVLDTLKSVKGDLYAKRVYMFATFSDLSYASGLPRELAANLLDTLIASWGYDITKDLDKQTIQMLLKDAGAYLAAKELRK